MKSNTDQTESPKISKSIQKKIEIAKIPKDSNQKKHQLDCIKELISVLISIIDKMTNLQDIAEIAMKSMSTTIRKALKAGNDD